MPVKWTRAGSQSLRCQSRWPKPGVVDRGYTTHIDPPLHHGPYRTITSLSSTTQSRCITWAARERPGNAGYTRYLAGQSDSRLDCAGSQPPSYGIHISDLRRYLLFRVMHKLTSTEVRASPGPDRIFCRRPNESLRSSKTLLSIWLLFRSCRRCQILLTWSRFEKLD